MAWGNLRRFPNFLRSQLRKKLLPENNADTSPPIFTQTDAAHLQIRRKVTHKDFVSRMKAQTRSNQPHKRRIGLKLDFRKIAVTTKISFDEVAANAQPVIDSLQRQVQIFGRLQLDDDQAPLARHSQKINHAALARCQRRNLRIKIPRIETRIEPRRIRANH